MKLKGSEAIVKVLLEQGVDTVFGYPGGAVIPLYDALYDAPLKNVLTAHEQGAIHAADGYARASGRTGVCIATSGPGATNIVTGLATAYLDSIPLVAITGQVGVSMLGRDSFQEIDIVGVTMPITKYNMLVRSKEELLPALRKAFALAQEGRPGPVLVDIPSSVQVEELEWSEPQAASEAEELPQATPEQLQQAAEVLNKAQRPVLLVGGGAVNSGAQEELLELAKKADLPVVNTLMGIGVYPESDERSLGMTGSQPLRLVDQAEAPAPPQQPGCCRADILQGAASLGPGSPEGLSLRQPAGPGGIVGRVAHHQVKATGGQQAADLS